MMMETDSRVNILEGNVKEILGQSEFSYEEWNQSKIVIRRMCEDGIPSNLRFLIWKHLVHNNLNYDELVVPSLSPSNPNNLSASLSSSFGSIQLNDHIKVELNRSGTTPTASPIAPPIFHNEMLNRDCLQLVEDYNLLDQIKTFNHNNHLGIPTPSTSTTKAGDILNSLNTNGNDHGNGGKWKKAWVNNTPGGSFIDPLSPAAGGSASSLSSSSGSSSGLLFGSASLTSPLKQQMANGGGGSNHTLISSSNSNSSGQLLSPPLPTDSLNSATIADTLQRFVRNFCTHTNREYSIDVVKLIIPFVLLSFVDQIERQVYQESLTKEQGEVESSHLPTPSNAFEEDWMNLSIKIVENLSNSGLLPYQSSNPILLCESEMFRILLLYHDPILAYFLDQRSVFSTTYFYEWINHMFAGCIDLKFLIQLWDILLFHESQDFYLYFALSVLISKREHILAVKGKANDILLVLEEKTIVNSMANQLKLGGLIKNAELYRISTPVSFIRNWNKFYTNCKHPNGPRLDQIHKIYNEFKYSICMGLDVEELILNSNYGKDPKIREKFQYYVQEDLHETNLLVFDCRPYTYFKSGRFPSACHLPPGLLISQPHEFDGVSKSFQDMKGVAHFAFYDNWFQFNPLVEKNDADTNDNGDMNMNILRFLKDGFPYVSRVPSGYKKIHDIFLSKGLQLAVHEEERCPVCNPNALNHPPPTTPELLTQNSQATMPVKKEKWFDKFKLGSKRQPSSNDLSGMNDNTLGGNSPRRQISLKSSSRGVPSLLDRQAEMLGLQDVSPFVIDSDDEQDEDEFKGNPCCYGADCPDDGSYYYIDYTISPIITPVYDPNRVKVATDVMEKTLKEYNGLEDWLEGSNLIFECEELQQFSGIREHRYIIITNDHFVSLCEHHKCIGYVKVECKYHLNDIRRIVYKKSTPNLLEFRIKDPFKTSNNNNSDQDNTTQENDHNDDNNNSINSTPTKLLISSSSSIASPTSVSEEYLKKFYQFSEIESVLKAIKDRTGKLTTNPSTPSTPTSNSVVGGGNIFRNIVDPKSP